MGGTGISSLYQKQVGCKQNLNPSSVTTAEEKNTAITPQSHPEYWFRIDLIPNELQRHRRLDLRYTAACFPYPSVEDQGTDGSCVVYAMSTAFLCAQRKANTHVLDSKLIDKNMVFHSARSLSGVSRHVSKGVTFSEAMKPIEELAQWYRIGRSTENFCACLQMGFPIVVGFALTKEMQQWQDEQQHFHDGATNDLGGSEKSKSRNSSSRRSILPDGRERMRNKSNTTTTNDGGGYHSVLFVGYDHDFVVSPNKPNGVFLARNSWGENWGMDGHFYFPYYLLRHDERKGNKDEMMIVLDAMIIDIVKTNDEDPS